MTALAQPKMTLAEYLAWEDQQPERHEFHAGEIYAMVGVRRSNGRVTMNLARHLGNHLAGSPCQLFAEAVKVRVDAETVLYPDLFVTCGQDYRPDDLVITDPVLIIEVLSPTTQRYDRSEKFALYRRLASLREYVLIDPDTRRVESFRSANGAEWVFVDQTDGGSLALNSLDCTVPLADVFDGLEPSP